MTGAWGWLWVAAIGLPLLTAVSLWAAEHDSATERVAGVLTKYAPLAILPTVGLAMAGPRAGAVDAPWLLLGTHLQIDPIGRSLLLVTALLYGAAVVAVWRSGTARRPRLTAFLLVCFLGNAGVFVAADVVTFYLSFAVMSLAAYGLVIHERTEKAQRAGRVYIVLTMISELAVLGGLLLIADAGAIMIVDAPAAVATSDQRNLIIALLLIGFGVKAGTFPLHVWLPLAHPAAPPPGSAVLSGTMIKAGLVGWLRFLPLGEVPAPGWGALVVGLSLVGAFLALVPGVLHNDPKVALAYSSISQMGFLGVLVGTALASPELAQPCILAAVVYAVHHGMAKGGLFLGVTVWRTHGYGWIRWWVIAGLVVLALAVAGAPLGSGAVAKYASKQALGESTFLWLSLEAVLPLVGTVTTILLARAVWTLVTGPREQAWGLDGAIVSWAVLIVGGTAFTWYLAEQWAPLLSVPGFTTTTLWDASWPILLGLGLLAVAWLLAHRNMLPRWARPDTEIVPPGDLVVPEERVAARTVSLLQRGAKLTGDLGESAGHRLIRTANRVPVQPLLWAERRLVDWVGSGLALTLTVLVVGLIVVAVVAW